MFHIKNIYDIRRHSGIKNVVVSLLLLTVPIVIIGADSVKPDEQMHMAPPNPACAEVGFRSTLAHTALGELCILHTEAATGSYLITLTDMFGVKTEMGNLLQNKPMDSSMTYDLLRLSFKEDPVVESFEKITFAKEPGMVTNLRKHPEGYYSYQQGIFAGLGYFRSVTKTFVFDEGRRQEYIVLPSAVNNLHKQDLHDILISDDEVVVLEYKKRPLSENENAVDARLTAFDMHSGQNIWSWDSAQDMGMTDVPGDYLHVNSVQWIEELDSFLISAKNTSALYLIRRSDKHTEEISCRTFECDEGVEWSDQHDARLHMADGTLSMYDNAEDTDQKSRGVLYSIDLNEKTLSVMKEYSASADEEYRPTLGSMQITNDGRTIVGWGGFDIEHLCEENGDVTDDFRDVFTVYDSADLPVIKVRAPCGLVTYRAFEEAQ